MHGSRIILLPCSIYSDGYERIRDDVVGHPTNRRNNKQFIYLAQYSLSKNHFRYIRAEACSNPSTILDVDVEKAISDVASCVNEGLKKAIERLDREFREYIDMHRERKMKKIFGLLGYAREKVLTKDYMDEWGYEATKNMY